MNQGIQAVIDYVRQNRHAAEPAALVNRYFVEGSIWSLEREEWLRMTEDQRAAFVEKIVELAQPKGGR